MNKQQKAYAIAKAAYETALHEQRAAEHEYITSNGIKNSDGTTPRNIYGIEDDAICDKAYEDLARYDDKRYNAFQELLKVEDALIDLTFRLDSKTVKR